MEIKTRGFEMPNGDVHVFIPPSPTQTERGGIIAKKKTTETVEVAVGEDDKLYVPGTDSTLTDETKAANAKATGDKISELKEDLLNKVGYAENSGTTITLYTDDTKKNAIKTLEIPSVTDDHINNLIDTKLGVIENGTY